MQTKSGPRGTRRISHVYQGDHSRPIPYPGRQVDAIRRATHLEFNYQGPFLEG